MTRFAFSSVRARLLTLVLLVIIPCLGLVVHIAGKNAYVVKPVDFSQFVDAVKEISAFWAVINQPPPGSA